MARRPSSSQSRCAGRFWKKLGGAVTVTLLGQQTNTWSQLLYRRSVHIRPSEASEGTYQFLLAKNEILLVVTTTDEGWEYSDMWRLVSHAHVLHNPQNTFNATMCWDYTSINILNKFRSVPVWTGSHKEWKLWKDIWMWASLVGRLGYCSTHGLRKEKGCMLSSPKRPWSMAAGGTLRDNGSPMMGCPPWHQRPLCSHSGGL